MHVGLNLCVLSELFESETRDTQLDGSLSFSCSRASLWNDLPEELHATESLGIFKRGIKQTTPVSFKWITSAVQMTAFFERIISDVQTDYYFLANK